MEDSKKAAEFAKMHRWVTAWIERLRANEDKKQAAVKAMKKNRSSMGSKYWRTIFKKDDNKLYFWFLDSLKDSITPWLTDSGDEFDSFVLRFGTEDLGPGNIGSYYPIGPCQAFLILQENIWDGESDVSNKSSLIHELGHHYNHLISCFSIKKKEIIRPNVQKYITSSPGQKKLILSIFSDHIVLKKILTRMDIANEDFKREDFTEGASFDDNSYSLFECKGVGGSLRHAMDREERSVYFAEWLQGSPMTYRLLLKLKRGKNKVLNFNWDNSTCEEARKMRQEVDRITSNNGVPFRFGGLVFLNHKLDDLVGSINDLVKHDQTTEQHIDQSQERDGYDPGAGSSLAYVINNLIKLANALDSTGNTKEADRVDALIRKNGIAIFAPLAIPGSMLIIVELIALAGLAGTVAWVIKELFIRHHNESSKEAVVDRALDALNKVEQTPESDYPINPEHNKAPTKEDVKVGVKDLVKLLPEISIIFDEKRKEERVYTISCFATNDGIDIDYFYFDSPSIPGLVVDDVCERLTDPGGIPVGYTMPGPILLGRSPKWGEDYDTEGTSSVKGSPDVEMENIVSWICKNRPWVDAVRVHDQAGPKYCGNKRQFSLLYEEQGVLHGPWRCKDD